MATTIKTNTTGIDIHFLFEGTIGVTRHKSSMKAGTSASVHANSREVSNF